MWKQTNINLGTIVAKINKEVIFEYSGDEEITDISTSCGCSQAEYKNGILKVTFFPNPVPTHLVAQGKDSYSTTKHITIKQGTKYIQLSFTAIIKNSL